MDNNILDNKNNKLENPTIKNAINILKNKNYNIISSIYTSKVFTKYALYNLLIYKITQNKYMGAVAFNCNSAAFLMFNYIRFVYPCVFKQYKEHVCKSCNIPSVLFNTTDFFLHTAPFMYMWYTKNIWLYNISSYKLILLSSLSYGYELSWAYYYANSIDVSKIYELDKININFTEKQCKQMWLVIAFFHYLSVIIKNIPIKIASIKY